MTMTLDDTHEIVLPPGSAEMLANLEASRRLLELEPDWDDLGSIPPTVDAWEDAVSLIANTAAALHHESPSAMPVPSISAGGDGDIDIVFRHGDRLVGINVSGGEGDAPVLSGQQMSGDGPRVSAVLGLDPDGESWFVHWLLKATVAR